MNTMSDYPPDFFQRSRALASSGQSLLDTWQVMFTTEAISVEQAAGLDDIQVRLFVEASRLLADSDFSALAEPRILDIAQRDHIYRIDTHLKNNPTTPLRTELEATVGKLRYELGPQRG